MKIVLHRKDKTREIEALAGERLLYCGLRHGVALPYECGSGTCGTCKAVLVSGKIDTRWAQAPGNRYVKADRGEFLMCQSVAVEDSHIRVRPPVAPPVELPVPQSVSGEIRNHRQLNDDVAVFDYQLERPLDYRAGQFVTVENSEISGFRAYSMTNYYEQPAESLNFVVKRIPDGGFTEWLFSRNRDGEPLNGFGPLGRAVFTSELDGDFIALVGGTGIAGIMAILENAMRSGHLEQNSVQLVFGLNRPKDAFFFDRLNDYCAAYPNLRVIVSLVEFEDHQSLDDSYPNLEFASGYVHEAANEILGDLSEISVAFLAGPPPAVNASMRMLMTERRISPRKMRFDKFG